jgi:hypothetical protein
MESMPTLKVCTPTKEVVAYYIENPKKESSYVEKKQSLDWWTKERTDQYLARRKQYEWSEFHPQGLANAFSHE